MAPTLSQKNCPPVLFLCHKRPGVAQKVLRTIAAAKPARLYVACDGPGKSEDVVLVREVRETVSQLAGKLETHYKFEPNNLGCGRSVQNALRWFFTHEEEGIILEDDTLPLPGFFPFVTAMLKKFRRQKTIATIGGFCPFPKEMRLPVPWFKTKYFGMWGWGSWARTWEKYPCEISPKVRQRWKQSIQARCESPNELEFWELKLEKIFQRRMDTWDYQMQFTAWEHGQSHIVPAQTLITNLGFNAMATHTKFQPLFSKHQNGSLDKATAHPFYESLIFYFRHLMFLETENSCFEQISKRLDQALEEIRWRREEMAAIKQSTDKWKNLYFKLPKVIRKLF